MSGRVGLWDGVLGAGLGGQAVGRPQTVKPGTFCYFLTLEPFNRSFVSTLTMGYILV